MSGGPASRYRVFGLTIESEIALDALDEVDTDAAPDVRIVEGDAAGALGAHDLARVGDAVVLTIRDLARFTITDGTRILVEAVPGASPRNLRLYLLGSAFGMLLHQRGLLPLHANAIAIDGRAALFCGASGAGKSTMAAWFHDRGHHILADDVCVVGMVKGVATAHAGVPRLRLWGDALATGGRDAADFSRSFEGLNKYDVPTRRLEDDGEALPLGAVYRLSREGTSEIHRLTGAAAVETLVANTYRGQFIALTGGTARHFAQCVALAQAVPVFSADRAWGFDCFDVEAGKLAAHAWQTLRSGEMV